MEFPDFGISKFPDYDATVPTVLIGCAPCQGFTAYRKKSWNQPDTRNSLVEAFADVAVSMQPDCVIMENVPELLSAGRYWKYFVHNAAEYGVPQARFRALIIAMKVDFSMPSSCLAPSEFRTVRDAISDLQPVSSGEQSLSDAFPIFQILEFPTFQLSNFPKFQISRFWNMGKIADFNKINSLALIVGISNFPDFGISNFPKFQFSRFWNFQLSKIPNFGNLIYYNLHQGVKSQVNGKRP